MKISNPEILQKHADLCSTMAHPKRLAILETLEDGEVSVGEIAEALGSSISTVSQHLRLMKDKSVVVARKDGQTVYYRLRNPKIVACCKMIREVLLEDLTEHGRMAKKSEKGRKA
jgi:ArsR family transcriptional regulator, virulence genes transcriptional regulator